MGRKYVRLCVGPSCFRVHSLSLQSKPSKNKPIRAAQIAELVSNIGGGDEDSLRMPDIDLKSTDNDHQLAAAGNKIMVVADPSLEAKGALEWALSHAVQNQDTLVLLHVVKPSRPGKFFHFHFSFHKLECS